MPLLIDQRAETQVGRPILSLDNSEKEFDGRLCVGASNGATWSTASPVAEESSTVKWLPSVLSATAGSADVISFLGLGGLFVGHVTGNLVLVVAHLVTGQAISLAPALSVPVFVAMVSLAKLAGVGCEAMRLDTLKMLLALHFTLLVSFLAMGVAAGSGTDPAAPVAVLAGLLGVAAMGVQNALVQTCLGGAPATTAMTADITSIAVDLGTMLFPKDSARRTAASGRVKRNWHTIIGFISGCCLGASLQAVVGPWSLALPTGFGLLAVAMGLSGQRRVDHNCGSIVR